MRNFSILCLAISFLSSASAQSLAEEFKAINAAREKREALVNYLKNEGKLKETKSGNLEALGELGESGKSILESENKNRLRQFAIIGEIEGKSAEEVATEFAKEMGVEVKVEEVVTLLKVHGSNTVGAKLAPELLRAFLLKRGYKGLSTVKNGVETTISFDQPGKKTLGRIEIKAHGSSSAFSETSSSKEVGLSGGFADIGMASRRIKDAEFELIKSKNLGDFRSAANEFPIALDGVAVIVNRSLPITSLTKEQIAKAFSGQVSNWNEFGGPDLKISVFARDDHSGTWDTFKSAVLKPAKLSLESSTKRFEDSGKLVKSVASTQGGIGFCGLAYVDSTVTGLAVSSKEGLIAFQPTRLTVKMQDYPLSRLLYFYMPTTANDFTRDFVSFTMSDEGQEVVDRVGLVGQGLATELDRANADSFKEILLADTSVPSGYKDFIAEADRRNSQANVRFSSGSNQPDINSTNNLSRLAGYLAEAGNEGIETILIGFADNVGSDSANIALSKKRAKAVANILRAKGVQNIKVGGFGEVMPVADNLTESGRVKNRRVEIWLKR